MIFRVHMASVSTQVRSAFRTLVVGAAVLLIRAYQLMVRPLLIGACKFQPTCSDYAIQALRLHGPWRGGLLAARRLLRCHPFTPGRIDPVPEADTQTATPKS